MEKDDLERILYGDIDHIREVNDQDIGLFGMYVIIYPKNVRKILLAYLNKKISEEQLIEWARFICIRTEYVVPDCLNDALADYYEDMYYVIQKISTPEIDGEINEASIREYLGELNKYGEH